MDERTDITRRSIVKKGAAMSGGLLAAGADGALAAEDEYALLTPKDQYQDNLTKTEDIGLDATVKSFGVYSSEIYTAGGHDTGDEWQYELHTQVDGCVRNYNRDESPEQGWKADRIALHNVTIDNRDTSNTAVFTTGNANHVGGYPAESYTAIEMTADVVKTLAESATASMDNYVNGLLTAQEIYDTLSAEFTEGNSSGSSNPYEYEWFYSGPLQLGDKHSDIGHHVRFIVQMPYDGLPTINVNHHMETINYTIDHDWKIELQGPDTIGGIKSTDTTRVPPGAASMSTVEREKYGVKLVPRAAAENAGYTIPDSSVVEGNMVWIMTNPPLGYEKSASVERRG